MGREFHAAALVATLCAFAWVSPATSKEPRRFAGMVQVEASTGGDDLNNDELQLTDWELGKGLTVSLGGSYRPIKDSPFELQLFVGYKIGHPVPVVAGPVADLTTSVFQFLGNYRFTNKWYVNGGLVVHGSPQYFDEYPGALDLKFDDAYGVLIEGGWNWVGLQCTYIKYKSEGYGTFDASNCGIRFTLRIPRWRPPSN